MSHLPSLRHVLPLLALSLPGALAAQGTGQSPTPPVVPAFGETIEVRVVNLEAVVTDRDGLPVSGLEPRDFLLSVDGEKVPIGYFTEVRGGQAISPTAEAEAPGLPGMPSLAPGTTVGTSYLVFIDDYFSIGRDRDIVVQKLIDDLPRLGPEDRMAVVAFDGRELTLLSSWSGSSTALARALGNAKRRKAFGLERTIELRNLESERRDFLRLGATFEQGIGGRLEGFELDYSYRLETQLRREVAAAVATLRGFAAPPGRKVMLMLSGGWPYEIGEFAAGGEFPRGVTEATLPRGIELFAPLADTANQLGYTLYTVDVPGLAALRADADIRSPSQSTSAVGDPFDREILIQYSLTQLARQTGGKALLNAQRLEAFATAQNDTRSYYWLGFTPTWKGDDSRHRVELKVLRPGLVLRSREGYVDISRRSEVSMAVESGLFFGSPPSADALGLELGELRDGRSGRMTQPFTVTLPGDQIVFLPQGESQVAQLELRVAAMDERGGRSEIPVIPVEIKAKRAALPGEKVTFENSVELRRTKQRLLVSVFDPLSGRLFTAMRDLKP